ncbi:MAG: pseudouridine synthase [Sneathiella sp.]
MNDLGPYNPPQIPFLDIIHVDEDLIVANKQSGLLSVPGRGPEKQDCLIHRLQTKFPEATIVHRLDMQTSGAMVFARKKKAQSSLGRSFQNREVDKNYQAWVLGCPRTQSGNIDLPLITDWPNRPRQMVDYEIGKASSTNWHILKKEEGRTLLSLTPITGRSHQLRVHLAEIGHPILGDPLYAPPEALNLAPRLLLHAYILTLPHPRTGNSVTFTAALPF